MTMKKNDILLGIIISIGMVVVASIPRFMTIDKWGQSSMLGAALYSFTFIS